MERAVEEGKGRKSGNETIAACNDLIAFNLLSRLSKLPESIGSDASRLRRRPRLDSLCPSDSLA